jgi:hypothetical protein
LLCNFNANSFGTGSFVFNTIDRMKSDSLIIPGENNINVRLSGNGQSMSCCDAVYIGLLGMQVNASQRVILMHPKGSQLEVELTLNKKNGSKRCKLPAIVTKRSNNHMGLTFTNNTLHANAILIEIILALGAHDSVSKG